MLEVEPCASRWLRKRVKPVARVGSARAADEDDALAARLGRSWPGFLPSQAFGPTRSRRAEDADTVGAVGAGVELGLPDVRVRLGDPFEWLEEDCDAIEDLGAVVPGAEETIFSGEDVAEYRAHVVSLSVVYELQ